jgi:hypothetical protein
MEENAHTDTDTDTEKLIKLCSNTTETVKKIKVKREKETRVEARNWSFGAEELSNQSQQEIIHHIWKTIKQEQPQISSADKIPNQPSKLMAKHVSHIKSKLSSYKHQDITKRLYDDKLFISFKDTIRLIDESCLKCHYCSCDVFILYPLVRESKQWSLDRINNNKGHNVDNLVISCLECNLKRRRTNKDAFLFTKNMKILRQGYEQSSAIDTDDN